MKYTSFNGEQEVYDMFEYRESTCEGVFEEKASREYYTIERFKKKYNYNPSDKTITVDGDKYRIDININKPLAEYINSKGETDYHARGIWVGGSSNGMPTISVDKDFFALKNDNRRDAILKHEIGHVKTLLQDKRGRGKAIKDAYEDSTKYLTGSSSHSDPIELQADAYAVSHTKGGAKAFKRALRETQKKGNKEKSIQRQYASSELDREYHDPYRSREEDEDILNAKYKDLPLGYDIMISKSKNKEDYLKKTRRDNNIAEHEDIKKRSKALKDEEFQKKMQKTFPKKKSDEKYTSTFDAAQKRYKERPENVKKRMGELMQQFYDLKNSLKFTNDENKRKEIQQKIDANTRERFELDKKYHGTQ